MKHYIDTDYFLEEGFVVPIEFTLEEHNRRAAIALGTDREVLRETMKVKKDKLKKTKKKDVKKKAEMDALIADIWNVAYSRMVIDHAPIPQQSEDLMNEKLAKQPVPTLT